MRVHGVLYPHIVGRINRTDVYVGGASKEYWKETGLDCRFRIPFPDSERVPKFYIRGFKKSGVARESDRGRVFEFLLINNNLFLPHEIAEAVSSDGSVISADVIKTTHLHHLRGLCQNSVVFDLERTGNKPSRYGLVRKINQCNYIYGNDRRLCLVSSVDEHPITARLSGDIWVSGPLRDECDYESKASRTPIADVERFHIGSPLAVGRERNSKSGRLIEHLLAHPEIAFTVSQLEDVAGKVDCALHNLYNDFQHSRYYSLLIAKDTKRRGGSSRRILAVNGYDADKIEEIDRELGLDRKIREAA
ncbi:hypothetical protein GF386_04995 [Candidatus Pacearchaeota archaeon]|nr:hypothetical protein [Candidatus Pacearchaeota archaeon]MBD3283470.1 hypothetical protein [Candidatus Pacearchaeota archaeon]